MSLHSGSRHFAHQLDRFSPRRDIEQLTVLAAQLDAPLEAVEQYWDWYGEDSVTVRRRATRQGRLAEQQSVLPAFEAHLRQDFERGPRLVILS